MHILFVEGSAGGVVGGSLTGLYHLIRGLDRERFRISMALYERKAIEGDLARLGVTVHHLRRRRLPKEHALQSYGGYHRARAIGGVRRALRGSRQAARLLIEEIPAAFALARVMRRERPDVVHLGNGLRANFDGILAARMTRTPAICHVKGFEKYGDRERWAGRRVRALVCMTQAILAHCHAHGIEPPSEQVVYDAVDESWLAPRAEVREVRRSCGVPPDAPCIGIIGNIQEWKGQHVVIEAMAALAASRPRLHCLVVGGVHRAGEKYAADLRARIGECGLAERVHFLGFRPDVVDVISALDVVVHASVRPEPFGRVILEGMLLGKPVIGTAAGGVPELIEHGRTGFLVPPGDAGALGACLDALLREPQAARSVGAAAQRWARERFSLRRQAEEMSEIYRAAAGLPN